MTALITGDGNNNTRLTALKHFNMLNLQGVSVAKGQLIWMEFCSNI